MLEVQYIYVSSWSYFCLSKTSFPTLISKKGINQLFVELGEDRDGGCTR